MTARKLLTSLLLLVCVAASAEDKVWKATPQNYLVFVGEYISVEEFDYVCPEDAICMDLGFKAKYRVLNKLYGEYAGETIDFIAYDHYGFPDFARFKTVMLFVKMNGSAAYHEKYRYYEVHPTQNGSWAYCGDPYDEETSPANRRMTNIAFEPNYVVDFIQSFNSDYVKRSYKAPVYSIEGDKVFCEQGVYINDLFRLERETVLKAREMEFTGVPD